MAISPSPRSEVRNESRAPDCVVSAAYGAGPDYVRTFLGTFRKVNQSARVILLVWDREPLRDIAQEHDAELHQDAWFSRHVPRMAVRYRQFFGAIANKRVRVTELLGRSNPLVPRLAFLLPDLLTRSLVSIPVARFFHIRDILSREKFGHVLLSDSRDVFFQDDPFASPVELELAREMSCFGSEPYTDTWIADGFGPGTLRALEGRPIFCSGTILGSQASVLDHVSKMCRQVKRLRTWKHGGIDQAIHNYVIWKSDDPQQYSISTPQRGRIVTLSRSLEIRIRDGLIVDEDENPFPIVHQYDRLSPDVLSSLRMLRAEPVA